MKLRRFCLPALALGGAAILVLPAQTDAFTVLGGSLDTTQRDFRIFDNFTDITANDNVTPDPNFPGYTGCELAIWKACTEWGSQLHGGTGDGDPHQLGGLGSGGANFDAVFQGNATSVGGTNNNTFSELAGSDAGVLAFTETPISDGWRIRFYSTWTWDDGPGTTITGLDIQAVACHTYGYALGLGATNVPGATMNSVIPGGGGVSARSIEADDIAGVQFIYGVASATKPRITGISFSGGRLTIDGVNFDSLANDVWFTPKTPGGVDVPVQVTGIPSNGSQITLVFPGAAGPGDVFVKVAGTAGSSLSNGWPIDPAGIVTPGVAYCFGDGSLPTPCPCALPNTVPNPSGASDAGCANSFNMNGAKLTAAGSTSPDTLKIGVDIAPGYLGFAFLVKGNATNNNGVASSDGVRCVDGQLIRFGSHNAGTNGNPVGQWIFPNSAQTTAISAATLQPAAETAYYQLFYRNAVANFCNASTANLSNGIAVAWP